MKKKNVHIPIYFGWLTVILADSVEELQKEHPEQDISPLACATVFTDEKVDNGTTNYVAAFFGQPEGQTIAHEAVHIVNRIFLDRGIQLTPYNDEPQAYLTGWVFETIAEALQEFDSEEKGPTWLTKVKEV